MMTWEESIERRPRRTVRQPQPVRPDLAWDSWDESTQDEPRARAHWGETAPFDPDRLDRAFRSRADRLLCISCNVPACTGCGFGRGHQRKQRKPAARGAQIELDL